MAITQVQSKGASAASGNATLGLTSTPVDGHLIALVLTLTAAFSGITALPAGISSEACHRDNASIVACIGIWYKIASGESGTYTFTNTSTNWGLNVYEFAGVDTVSPLDTSVTDDTGAVTTNSYKHLPFTPGASGDAVVGGVVMATANGGGETVDSSFAITSASDGSRMVGINKIKTDVLAEDVTIGWTNLRAVAGALAAFKPAGAAGIVLPDRMSPRGNLRGTLRGTT